MPTRKSDKNTKLKMRALKPDWDPRDKFDFKEQEISEEDKKRIIARVVEIATRTLFENHAYKFGNTNYKQSSGGSIGDRWTGAAAELVMQDWADNYEQILVKSGLEVPLLAGYVDDGRQGTTILEPGMKYCTEDKKFKFCQESLEEDKLKEQEGETTNQRMARICNIAMNDINPELEFTVETADDFEDKKLPTLDFCIWQEEDGSINHTYYQKPIKSPYVIMERSSMSKQQKLQILANEMTRRLSNINKKRIKQEEYNRVVDQMSQELKNSGYTRKNAVEIISSGIRGWKARISRQEKAGQDMYRNAARTLTSRTRKKLISRENWYKKNKNTEADNTKQIKTQKNRKTENKNKKNENNKQHKTQELQQVTNKN